MLHLSGRSASLQLTQQAISHPIAQSLVVCPRLILKGGVFGFCHAGGHRPRFRWRPLGSTEWFRCKRSVHIVFSIQFAFVCGCIRLPLDVLEKRGVDERRQQSTNVYPSRDGVSTILPVRSTASLHFPIFER